MPRSANSISTVGWCVCIARAFIVDDNVTGVNVARYPAANSMTATSPRITATIRFFHPSLQRTTSPTN